MEKPRVALSEAAQAPSLEALKVQSHEPPTRSPSPWPSSIPIRDPLQHKQLLSATVKEQGGLVLPALVCIHIKCHRCSEGFK